MSGNQGNDGFDTQEVRRHEIADMQHVALQVFGIVRQQAQLVHVRGDLHPQGVLDGLRGGKGMRDGADAADAAHDDLDLVVLAAPHHGFEEAGGFRHLPLQFFNHAILGPKDQVAMALDPSDVVDVDLKSVRHGEPP